MTISISQIKAARAMKNWNQQELAKRAKVAVPTIANIEIGKQNPSARTLQKIKKSFEKSGIEFVDHDGIRKQKGSVEILRGTKAFKSFFYLVYEHVKTNGGDIYLSNVRESDYTKWWPELYQSDYFYKMVEIRSQFNLYILTRRQNKSLSASAYAQYKYLPDHAFSPIPFEVFGDHLAIKLLFLDEPIIYLIKDQKVADLYREKFLEQWKSAEIPINC